MAKYRQLYTEFWNDNFVLNLEPEEKYFYIYLLTNPNTSQCGIYELPKKIMEMQTGHSKERVDSLLKKFEEYKKIIYSTETNEVIILNWVKYNEPNNINAIKCVNKEIKKIKNRSFVKELYFKYSKIGLEVDKLFSDVKNGFISEDKNNKCEDGFKDITRGHEGAYEGIVSKQIINNKEKIINNKKEVVNNSCCSNKEDSEYSNISKNNNCEFEKQQRAGLDEHNHMLKNNDFKKHINTTITAVENKRTDTTADSGGVVSCRANFKDVKDIFESNIHKLVPMEEKKIIGWGNKFDYDMIVMAIEEAIVNNVKNIGYIEKILNTWFSKGLTSPKDIKDYKSQWAAKKNKMNSKENFVDHWNYDGQREYDFEDLERKLLGWEIA